MKKLLIFFVLAVFILPYSKAFAASPHPVAADSALLIDASSGKVLYSKNEHERFFPASTTKIMTALVVLEHCKLDDKVIIGKKPSSFVDGSKIYIFEGEELTVDELLHALLIASANDAAIALAEHVAGTEEAFADLMNEKAKELGCLDTHFVNSHGLDDPNHYTTAYDLMLIAKEAMKNDTFRQIVSTKSYSMAPTNKQPLPRPLNTNIFTMLSSRYHVDGANGIKVGYTDIAGHSFVGSAYKGDTKLMVVLMHDQTKAGMWEDASSLLNYGLNNYKTAKELQKDDIISNFKVPGTNIEAPLAALSDFYYTFPSDSIPEISTKVVTTSNYFFNILKGQKIGYLEFMDKGVEVGRVDLIATSELTSLVMYQKKYSINESSNILLSPLTVVYSSILFFISMFMLSIATRRKRRSSK